MIAEQALAFVAESGLERLTMSQLAKELGVAASALYNHLDNKADLVLLIQEALMSQVSVRGMVGVIALRTTLEEALEDWARSYRAVFAKYPSLIPLIAVTPVSDAPQSSRMYNVVAQALMVAGVPEPQVINVIVAFESFLFGSALDLNAPSTVLDAGDESEGSAWLARAVSASKRAHDESAEAPDANNVYADHPFRFGLSALIAFTLALTGQPAAAD
ncbi:TetR/AcrR family transcriptional regulator C-terminal domain-containing protein [Yaniella flava]|uniref:TetR/AcrR family transcriptional regulator C-terminal domain-containing protein n=2 Tax=Yaniella flava TaxID=287930 RepID=A0ABN2U999_9MICC